MIDFVVGCDGGGTKTDVLIMDIEKNIIGSQEFGALNINGNSIEIVENTIKNCVNFIKKYDSTLKHCKSICVGSAGISNENAINLIKNTFIKSGYTGKLLIVGDQEAALAGALGESVGAVIVAGTGSICFGKNKQGDVFRCGGYGHIIDDEGSGYAVGRDVLSAVVRAYDNRIKPTILMQMVFEIPGINDVQSLVKFVYDKTTDKKAIAGFAKLASLAAKQGDEIAYQILINAAKNLSELAIPTISALNLSEGKLAMAGSMLLNIDIIREEFINIMKSKFENLSCVLPKDNATIGAALIALESIDK